MREQIWRNTDPVTSEIAGRRKNATTRKRDRDLLLELIRHDPRHTAMELADILIQLNGPWIWYRAYQICNKRIADLVADGLIEVHDTRICDVTGHKARTWIAI